MSGSPQAQARYMLARLHERPWHTWPHGSYARTLAEAEARARAEGRPWPPPYPGTVQPERPDPLAPPAGYGERPGRDDGPDLSVCSTMTSTDGHCARPVAEVMHIGCLQAEHAGKVAYCAPCAVSFTAQAPFVICGQCQDKGQGLSRIRIYKRETTDGRELPLEPEPVPQSVLSSLFQTQDGRVT